MADWIGVPDPSESSAPLYPTGARQRYDPRAPGGVPGTIVVAPPLPPPWIANGSDNTSGGSVRAVPTGAPQSQWPPPPPDTCRGVPLLQNKASMYGWGTPGAVITLKFDSPTAWVGQVFGTTQVPLDGQWVVVTGSTLPDGIYSTVATQTTPGSNNESAPSPSYEFRMGLCDVAPAGPQGTDTGASAFRYSPARNWQHGTMAYHVNGVWTYGVLRKIG